MPQRPELRRAVWMAAALGWAAAGSTALAAEGDEVWPGGQWERVTPAEAGMDAALLGEARDYALRGGGSGMIVRRGRLVMAWGDPDQRYDLKSSSKSIGGTLLGLAIGDGKVHLDDRAADHHFRFGVPPEANAQTGWLDTITLRHLANQTAGFDKPGGYEPLLFAPGTRWHYSDGGPNWLAECLTLVYKRDLNEVIFERVFTPLGIGPDDIRWRRNAYRPHQIQGIERREFGSGFSANVDAMARIGYLYLRRGRWKDRQILPADYVEKLSRPAPENVGLEEYSSAHDNASDHYSLLWWNNGDGTIAEVPRDAYWSWGLYDSLIVVIPSLDMVVARAGKSLPRDSDGHYDVLRPFLVPIASSVGGPSSPDSPDAARSARTDAARSAPYPPSPVLRGIRWAPADAIVRRAPGSDNWPITWGDDDRMYTAYGDGRGFEPFVPRKLSLGVATVTGGPDDFQGTNLRSPQIEFTGDGPSGPKASGMLMVDGVLYLWARNRQSAQLAWSADRGASWEWADWKFQRSFGCPTFLNFGRNYAGAMDTFVYIYSPDSESAYQPADRMVLARVPKDRLAEREAYTFFAGCSEAGEPLWSGDLARRAAVFRHPARCYRSGITYNAALRRYLWCQILPTSRDPRGPRFQGGLGIYDAPEPWGPWTTVYYADPWDVGPGESARFPTRWMSDDGRTVHLVFSGDDCFSVRRAELLVGHPTARAD